MPQFRVSVLAVTVSLIGSIEAAIRTQEPAEPRQSLVSSDVTTRLGNVQGSCSNDVCSFKGLPYANALSARFAIAAEKTSDFTSDGSTFDANTQGPPCVQASDSGFDEAIPTGQEDCLHINIWAPAAPVLQPVMFWIYGGGFTYGWNGQSMYDGAKLAKSQSVIVATPNYRLGIFGMYSSASQTTTNGRAGGMNMVNDALVALHWTSTNIDSFGGDGGAVTIFGESSGAMATCFLVTSPQAVGLFRAAIIESGACTEPSMDVVMTQNEGYAASCWLLEKIGVTEAQALSMDAASLQAQIDSSIDFVDLFQKGPNAAVDGYLLTARPTIQDVANANLQALVWGYTAGDATAAFTPPTAGVRAFLEDKFDNDVATKVLAGYPEAAVDVPADMFLDACLRCQTLDAVYANAAHPTYVYEYAGEGPQSEHGSEVHAVFGNSRTVSTLPANVVTDVQNAWGKVAHLQLPPFAGWSIVPASGSTSALRFGNTRSYTFDLPDPFAGECGLWWNITSGLGYKSTTAMCFEVSTWSAT